MTFRSLNRHGNRTLFSWGAMGALLLSLTAGCQQRVSQEELGTVIFKTEELPGAGEPYNRPEMAAPIPPPPMTDVVLPGAIDELR